MGIYDRTYIWRRRIGQPLQWPFDVLLAIIVNVVVFFLNSLSVASISELNPICSRALRNAGDW